MPFILTQENFDCTIKVSIILVGFWSPNCRPCQKMASILIKLSKQYVVGKVNIDDEPDLAKKYNVESVPCLLLFKDGKIIQRLTGLQSCDNLKGILENGTNL